jgi:hypothetical protein
MVKSKRSRAVSRRRPTASSRHVDPAEEGAAVAVTIAWTVSVTAVLLADLITAASHFYLRENPDSQTAAAFEAIMSLSACVIGLVSLALLPVVWRVRRVAPPLGFAVFAGTVAAAPVVAVVFRIMS